MKYETLNRPTFHFVNTINIGGSSHFLPSYLAWNPILVKPVNSPFGALGSKQTTPANHWDQWDRWAMTILTDWSYLISNSAVRPFVPFSRVSPPTAPIDQLGPALVILVALVCVDLWRQTGPWKGIRIWWALIPPTMSPSWRSPTLGVSLLVPFHSQLLLPPP